MDGFYKDMLTLAKDEFDEEELEVLRPTLTFFNGYFRWFTRTLLHLDMVTRLRTRIADGGLEAPAEGDTVLLALTSQRDGVLGVAELSLQPRDGRVPGDLRPPSLPWSSSRDQEPVVYMSNLAIRSGWRGRGLGGSLV